MYTGWVDENETDVILGAFVNFRETPKQVNFGVQIIVIPLISIKKIKVLFETTFCSIPTVLFKILGDICEGIQKLYVNLINVGHANIKNQ